MENFMFSTVTCSVSLLHLHRFPLLCNVPTCPFASLPSAVYMGCMRGTVWCTWHTCKVKGYALPTLEAHSHSIFLAIKGFINIRTRTRLIKRIWSILYPLPWKYIAQFSPFSVLSKLLISTNLLSFKLSFSFGTLTNVLLSCRLPSIFSSTSDKT